MFLQLGVEDNDRRDEILEKIVSLAERFEVTFPRHIVTREQKKEEVYRYYLHTHDDSMNANSLYRSAN